MREVFQRIEDGSIVNIEVETDAGDSIKGYPWLFSLFVKVGIDATEEKTAVFLETKESIIISLEKKHGVLYAGERLSEGWYELYFYARDSKGLQSAATDILKESGYSYESNVVKDSKWDFYHKNLYPSELEFCNIQSDKIVEMLTEEGDELALPREVEHYASFDTASQKERFVASALEAGFEFIDDIDSEEFEHGAALLKVHPVTKDEVSKVVKELYGLAKKEHGWYEGWSTVAAGGE